MHYAGIGSRKLPQQYYGLFESLGYYLAILGWTLHSGHADGSDISFENGCNQAKGNKEIYLPWYRFNGSNSNLIVKDPRAFDIAEEFHPTFNDLNSAVQKLMARNSHQVLGKDLNTPVKFILCYTPPKGGTTQALRIAKHYNIPIFNLYDYKNINDFILEFNEFLSHNGVIVFNYIK